MQKFSKRIININLKKMKKIKMFLFCLFAMVMIALGIAVFNFNLAAKGGSLSDVLLMSTIWALFELPFFN